MVAAYAHNAVDRSGLFCTLLLHIPNGHFVPRWTRWSALLWGAIFFFINFFPGSALDINEIRFFPYLSSHCWSQFHRGTHLPIQAGVDARGAHPDQMGGCRCSGGHHLMVITVAYIATTRGPVRITPTWLLVDWGLLPFPFFCPSQWYCNPPLQAVGYRRHHPANAGVLDPDCFLASVVLWRRGVGAAGNPRTHRTDQRPGDCAFHAGSGQCFLRRCDGAYRRSSTSDFSDAGTTPSSDVALQPGFARASESDHFTELRVECSAGRTATGSGALWLRDRNQAGRNKEAQ